MFISEHYRDKLWTNHERKAAQQRALADAGKEYILPAYFDTTITLPGLTKGMGSISLAKKPPEQVASLTRVWVPRGVRCETARWSVV